MRARVKIDAGGTYVYEAPNHVKVGDRVDLPASRYHLLGHFGTVTALDAGRYDGPAKHVLRVTPEVES